MNTTIRFGNIEFKGFILEGMKLFLKELINILSENKDFMKLHNKASEQGQVFVVFKDSDQLFCNAEWNPISRTIKICDHLDFMETIDSLIFEMCNAANTLINSEFMMLSRYETDHDYAFAMEHCEFFYTTLPYRKILPKILLDCRIIELLQNYDSNVDAEAVMNFVETELESHDDFASDWALQNQSCENNHYSHAEIHKEEFRLWKKLKEEQSNEPFLKSGENYLEHMQIKAFESEELIRHTHKK